MPGESKRSGRVGVQGSPIALNRRGHMNAEQAVARFRRAAENGKVNNARTGKGVSLTKATLESIISTVASVFRFAAGVADLAQIDYRAYADFLGQWAMAEAEAHGLSDASNRAARCRRFVRTVDGRAYKKTRPLTRTPFPPAWKKLGDALRAASMSKSKRSSLHGQLMKLIMVVGPLGIRSPHELPNRVDLKHLLTKKAGMSSDMADGLIWAYRHTRGLAVARGDEFQDIDQCAVVHQRGLRSLPDIVDRLEKAGYSGTLKSIETTRIIELLAPPWHEAMRAFLDASPAASVAWKDGVVNASSRMLAELARTKDTGLSKAHPTRLLVEQVDTGQRVEVGAPGGEEWARDMYGDGSIPVDDGATTTTIKIPLIAQLAASSAKPSSENSCVYVTDKEGEHHWTDTVQGDVQIIGDMGLFAGGRSVLFQRHPEIGQRAEAELKAFKKRMRAENQLRSFGGRKPKEVLLDLATYPMILFLGLPALRKRALCRRDDMYSAMLRHQMKPDHPSVSTTEAAYHSALFEYVLLAFIYADGLRLANYTHARLGPASKGPHAVIHTAPCGHRVRSYTHIEPRLDGRHLTGVSTNFFGDDHRHVKLKIDRIPGTKQWRVRPHWIRPGLIDFELLQEYLTVVRPKNLALQGLIPSAALYNLADDVQDLHFALFVSPNRSRDPYRAITGAYGPQTIEITFGRAFHWVLTTVLGRTLPPWQSAELKKKYPRLFAPHVSRLKAGSYIYGMLGRAAQAQTLLNDTLRTVERSYTVVEASMIHKTGWEAPHFFDDLFERVWDKNEMIDWDVVDPVASLPAELRPPGLDSVL